MRREVWRLPTVYMDYNNKKRICNVRAAAGGVCISRHSGGSELNGLAAAERRAKTMSALSVWPRVCNCRR